MREINEDQFHPETNLRFQAVTNTKTVFRKGRATFLIFRQLRFALASIKCCDAHKPKSTGQVLMKCNVPFSLVGEVVM